jgi:hypothetical protein
MKTIKTKQKDDESALMSLSNALERRAGSEQFIQKSFRRCIEELKQDFPGDETAQDVIGCVSDPALIEQIAEQISLETMIEACETKLKAAKSRHETVKERNQQAICYHFDLPDNEPIRVDATCMKVLRGSREERIEGFKEEIYRFIDADEDELKAFIAKKREGQSLESDLVSVLLEDGKAEIVKLCDEIFRAKKGDEEFLDRVRNYDDIPKPIRAMAEFVITERGLKCLRRKILEWR